MQARIVTYLVFGSLMLGCTCGVTAEPGPSSESDAEIAAGHSYHGEAFNEGPRQAAVPIEGMANIAFPSSAKSPEAQAFIEQGIAQLHGFWYLESERSFRQAAKIQPELAIAYWGMAMANVNNKERARGLIDEAMQRRNVDTTRREKMYIEALDRFIPKPDKDDEKKSGENEEESNEDDEKEAKQLSAEQKRDAEKEAAKKRAEKYIADLESIVHEFPDDVEAKALIAVQLWMSERAGVKMPSRYAVSALLGEVFEENPMHPAHHYRIHLWDSQRPENALRSAALCGPASPGIAHMWHMPGHIYSRLKRYADAAWQQEASARVDHAHMARARIIPDQIHNYAHNNEWLTRNLIFIGRVREALDQARNLVSLPRHPKYNSLSKRGSYTYGRMRLLQTMSEYELWNDLIAEAEGPSLPMTDDKEQQAELMSWLAVAHFRTGNERKASKTLRQLRRRLKVAQKDQDKWEAASKAEAEQDSNEEEASGSDESKNETEDEQQDPKAELKKAKERVAMLKKKIARVDAAAASMNKDTEAFKKAAKDAKLDKVTNALWLADSGDLPEAIKLAESAAKSGKAQVRPQAVLVDLLWRDGKHAEVEKAFAQLRLRAGQADIETPLLAKLAPIATELNLPSDWRLRPEPADDLGERPALETLGPFRWEPYESEPWEVRNAADEVISSHDLGGRPRLVIFYLGYGCLHCVEQLHAFSPLYDQYREAGIDVIAISTESVEQLNLGLKHFEEEMVLPLYADVTGDTFRRYRCWDSFEDQPLHGTFLIDSNNRVRWQDISYEPFMDAEFLLEEAKRLLAF